MCREALLLNQMHEHSFFRFHRSEADSGFLLPPSRRRALATLSLGFNTFKISLKIKKKGLISLVTYLFWWSCREISNHKMNCKNLTLIIWIANSLRCGFCVTNNLRIDLQMRLDGRFLIHLRKIDISLYGKIHNFKRIVFFFYKNP